MNVESRLKKLERTNRILFALLAVSVAGFFMAAAYATKVLQLESVEIAKAAKVLGTFGIDKDFGVSLSMEGSRTIKGKQQALNSAMTPQHFYLNNKTQADIMRRAYLTTTNLELYSRTEDVHHRVQIDQHGLHIN